MNSLFLFHGLKFDVLMSLSTLAIATFSIPTTAVAEEACVRTSNGSIVCGTRVQKPNAGQSVQVITAKEFIFELQECKRVSEAIKCEVDVINKEKDRGLSIYGNGSYQSSLTDLQGKRYLAKYVDFGAVQNNQYVTQNLVQDVRLKAFVIFDAIPPEVKQLQLVEITAAQKSGGLFPVRFRGVSISD